MSGAWDTLLKTFGIKYEDSSVVREHDGAGNASPPQRFAKLKVTALVAGSFFAGSNDGRGDQFLGRRAGSLGCLAHSRRHPLVHLAA